jgi:hypothetical protein
MMVARLADKKAVFANEASSPPYRLVPRPAPRPTTRDRLYADPPSGRDVREVALGRVENRELVLRRADGEPFPAMLTARAIAYEGDPCAVVSFQDLSALKAAEDLIAASATRSTSPRS